MLKERDDLASRKAKLPAALRKAMVLSTLAGITAQLAVLYARDGQIFRPNCFMFIAKFLLCPALLREPLVALGGE